MVALVALVMGVAFADDAAPEEPPLEEPPLEEPPPEATPAEAEAPPPGEESAAPADDDAGWVDLSPPAGDLGSALAPLETREPEQLDLPPELAEAMAEAEGALAAAQDRIPGMRPKARTRGRFGGRPRLAATGIAEDSWGMLLGVSATHQWWRLSDRPVRPAGETRLDLGGRVGAARGGDVRLTSIHGVWFGPVGVLGGAARRWDRLAGASATLDGGLTVGPQARVALRLPGFLPWAAGTRSWVVAGPRAETADGSVVIEDTLDFGVDLGESGAIWRFSGALRDTRVGTVWEAGLGLHLQL